MIDESGQIFSFTLMSMNMNKCIHSTYAFRFRQFTSLATTQKSEYICAFQYILHSTVYLEIRKRMLCSSSCSFLQVLSVHPNHPCSKPANPCTSTAPSNEDLCVNNITTSTKLSISFDQAKEIQRNTPIAIIICGL